MHLKKVISAAPLTMMRAKCQITISKLHILLYLTCNNVKHGGATTYFSEHDHFSASVLVRMNHFMLLKRSFASGLRVHGIFM